MLLDHTYFHGEHQEFPFLVYRREINKLKRYGTIVCFEALVISASEVMDPIQAFRVQLFHDSQIANNFNIDIVMELNFIFEPDINTGYTEHDYIKAKDSHLVIYSYSAKRNTYLNQKFHTNPIVAGMPIVMIIKASEGNYTININGGDDIYYPHHIFPHWSINRVEITGHINYVLFDGNSDKCRRLAYNIPEAKLEEGTQRVIKQLNSRSKVIISGKTPDILKQNITVNFLHAAIEWNDTIGNTIFQMNITGKYICIDSYTNGSWIKLKRNDTNICYSHQGLKKNEEIKLILTFKNSSLCYILETKENVDENNVILDIPISLTQYIQVNNLKKYIADLIAIKYY
uniref:Galectin n=1 Tax=Meloidogyne incognita TaxID=6306 RepID=A0A914LMD1_MELIC